MTPSSGAFYEGGVRIVVDPFVVPRIDKEELWAQDAGFTFMYGQLTGDVDCDGQHRVEPLPRQTFDTACLSRVTADGASVHIYEMYWADLSRLRNLFRRIFGEFYQLLFHVSSLGRHTVDEARDDAKIARDESARRREGADMASREVPAFYGKWRWLARAQRAAEQCSRCRFRS